MELHRKQRRQYDVSVDEHTNLEKPKDFDEPSLEDLLTSRFVVYGDVQAMRVYHWFEQFEENCRRLARRSRPAMLDLWQQGLMLQAFPYLPGNTHDYTHPGDTLEQWSTGYSLNYRMLLGAYAARTAKVALDAALTGYYSQCLALCRSLYEAYKRMVFVRIRPNEVYRWLPEEMINEEAKHMDGYHRSTKPLSRDDWNNLFPEEGMANDDASRVHASLLRRAQSHMEYLNKHAHPDLEGTTDLMEQEHGELDPYRLDLAPEFSEMHLDRAMHVGCSALAMLLVETSQLDGLPPWWREAHQQWMRRFATLFAPDSSCES